MKLSIEINNDIQEDEIIIRSKIMNNTVQRIQNYIQSLSELQVIFYKKEQEFYFPLKNVLFFETESEQIYAHTASDAFTVKHKLYELEALLPAYFARAAKGTIVNTTRIYSITRNLTSASLIKFADTHKQVYVSRHYFKELKSKMIERGI